MPLQEVQNIATEALKQQGSLKQSSMAPQAAVNTQEALPVFDLSEFIALEGGEPTPGLVEQCKQLAECLARTGCLVVSMKQKHSVSGDVTHACTSASV